MDVQRPLTVSEGFSEMSAATVPIDRLAILNIDEASIVPGRNQPRPFQFEALFWDTER